MKPQNLLITSAGRRVSLARFFQKALGSRGSVICADAKPELSSACQAVEKCVKLPRVDSPDFEEQLLQTCLENNVRLVIPTIDTELLLFSRIRSKFLEQGINIIVSSESFIKICRDKRKTHEFFVQNEIEVPALYDRQNPSYPLFVKPYDGSRSVNTHLVSGPSDLTDEMLKNPKLMFMEAIDHNSYSEVTIDLYYDKTHKLRCVVPRQRIEVRDGEVNKAITVDDGILQYVTKRLSLIDGVVGCINLQVFKHNETNQLKGIEINPRFGGGYPLSYHAGARFPDYIVSEYLDEASVDSNITWEKGVTMLRYDDEIIVRS